MESDTRPGEAIRFHFTASNLVAGQRVPIIDNLGVSRFIAANERLIIDAITVNTGASGGGGGPTSLNISPTFMSQAEVSSPTNQIWNPLSTSDFNTAIGASGGTTVTTVGTDGQTYRVTLAFAAQPTIPVTATFPDGIFMFFRAGQATSLVDARINISIVGELGTFTKSDIPSFTVTDLPDSPYDLSAILSATNIHNGFTMTVDGSGLNDGDSNSNLIGDYILLNIATISGAGGAGLTTTLQVFGARNTDDITAVGTHPEYPMVLKIPLSAISNPTSWYEEEGFALRKGDDLCFYSTESTAVSTTVHGIGRIVKG